MLKSVNKDCENVKSESEAIIRARVCTIMIHSIDSRAVKHDVTNLYVEWITNRKQTNKIQKKIKLDQHLEKYLNHFLDEYLWWEQLGLMTYPAASHQGDYNVLASFLRNCCVIHLCTVIDITNMCFLVRKMFCKLFMIDRAMSSLHLCIIN